MGVTALRKAVLEETADLSALIDASVRGLSRAHYDEDQMNGALGSAFGVDGQLIRDGTYFVVEVQGLRAACGGWSFRKTLFGADGLEGREPETLDPARDAAKIRAFFVHPDFARRGLGRLLLRHCEAEARQAGFLSLELMATLPGVPLYTALGFHATGRHAHVLPNGRILPMVPMRREIGGTI